MTSDEQIPTLFPLLVIPLIKAIKKSQLLAALQPDHEHPELGLVSTSIQTVLQRLEVIPLIRPLTCAVASFPRQGNMQTSVDNPAALAFWRLVTALVSNTPLDLQALTMAKVLPLFLRQVKVEVEVGLAISMPLIVSTATIRQEMIPKQKIGFIINRYFIQRFISISYKIDIYVYIKRNQGCQFRFSCMSHNLKFPINCFIVG